MSSGVNGTGDRERPQMNTDVKVRGLRGYGSGREGEGEGGGGRWAGERSGGLAVEHLLPKHPRLTAAPHVQAAVAWPGNCKRFSG